MSEGRWVVQFSRFSMVGFASTVVDLFVLNAQTLVTGAREGVGYALQKAVSFAVAAVVSYVLNRHWTFEDRSSGPQNRKIVRFLAVSLLGAGVNVSVATAAVTFAKGPISGLWTVGWLTDQVWVNIGALCGTGAGFLWNFLGYRFLVFRP